MEHSFSDGKKYLEDIEIGDPVYWVDVTCMRRPRIMKGKVVEKKICGYSKIDLIEIKGYCCRSHKMQTVSSDEVAMFKTVDDLIKEYSSNVVAE